MSDQKTNPRWIAGKHLTLTDSGLLPFITRIPSNIVPPLSMWRGLCHEAMRLIEAGHLPPEMAMAVQSVNQFLIEHLTNSISIDGKGRTELVQAIQALEEQQLHRDAGMPMDRPERGGLRP